MLPGGTMPVTQLTILLRTQPVTAAMPLMMGLRGDRQNAVASALPAETIAALLPVLSPERQPRPFGIAGRRRMRAGQQPWSAGRMDAMTAHSSAVWSASFIDSPGR